MSLRGIALALVAAAWAALALAPLVFRATGNAGAVGLVPLATLLALVGACITTLAAYRAWSAGIPAWVPLALAGASVPIVFPVAAIASAKGAPAIHDVSTDTDDPPAFVAAIPERTVNAAPNSTDWDPATVPLQKAAFPDLQPLVLDVAPATAFARAEAAVHSMGWALLDAAPDEGRIEATDTTLLFGFQDDIVVRVRPEGTGSRVDVRSCSRVGGGDLGTNAKRIRRYLDVLGGKP